jgi:hypothetical protein
VSDESTTIVHLAGPCIRFENLQRQRCLWCGSVLVDDDLERMAFPINEDGSVPDPPKGFPFERFVEVTKSGGFRATSVVEVEPLEDGSVRVPDNACMRMPAELTGREVGP